MVRQVLAAVWIPLDSAVATQKRRMLMSKLGSSGNASRIDHMLMVTGPERIHLGSSVYIGAYGRLQVFGVYAGYTYNGAIRVGDRTRVEPFSHIGSAYDIRIGADVTIASRVTILDHDHGTAISGQSVLDQHLVGAPISVGNYCWIGEGAFIGKGVNLGENCIVGANAVVTRSFPPGAVVGGVPARLIRMRLGFATPEEIETGR